MTENRRDDESRVPFEAEQQTIRGGDITRLGHTPRPEQPADDTKVQEDTP